MSSIFAAKLLIKAMAMQNKSLTYGFTTCL